MSVSKWGLRGSCLAAPCVLHLLHIQGISVALCFVVTSCMHSRAGLCLSYCDAQGKRCSTMCAWPTPPDLGGSDQVCRLHFVVCLHARMLARLYACIDVLSACMCASPVFFSVCVCVCVCLRIDFFTSLDLPGIRSSLF